MNEYDNQATVRTVRAIKAQALREAVDALEDVDPDDVREWLSERADGLDGAS